jgi:alpha-beta hydrolase superfamily lysophospholipase
MRRRSESRAELRLLEVEQRPLEDGVSHLVLHTDKGPVHCRWHGAGRREGVLWFGGAGGGLDGPAGGLYPRLAARLSGHGVSSLRVDYRNPVDFVGCVLDALLGCGYAAARGCDRLALVGHSAGGAVVIAAGARSPAVVGVAALSSQTFGTEDAPALRPRRLLLLHGSADEVVPDTCSRDIYRRAAQPKELIVYPGCRHGLDQCREQVDADLTRWLLETLGSVAVG